ncbi:MAG: dephospho-CoA kinase [Deltaproteobacteria bacterium]|nr:dephospho-CoA kinase [Deltaproteobacteria bacterium]
MIVGVTGSIGTGKSTVSAMFAELGAHLIDYDRLARDVVEPGRPAYQAIAEAFGPTVVTPDRSLDRTKIGDMVFASEALRQKLNAIVHPAVFEEDLRLTKEILQTDPGAIIIKEIPLLTQIGIDPKALVDKVVVVSASPEVQVLRVMGRGFSEDQARARVAAQVPVSETEKCGDFIIRNNGALEETRKQVEEVFRSLIAS